MRQRRTLGASARAGFTALLVVVGSVVAGASDDSAPISSMGQPPRLKPYVAGSFTWNREGEGRTGGLGVAGLYKDLVMPMTGAIGLSAEGYFGAAGGSWDGGARLLATSRLLFFSLGVDWNARDDKANFILAFTPYLRRGGLFHTGGNFRIEWIPGRQQSFNFGFQIPLEPRMGITRPVRTNVALPKAARPFPSALPTESETAIVRLRHAAVWLFDYSSSWNAGGGETYDKALPAFRNDLDFAKASFRAADAGHPGGHAYAQERRHYDEAFREAFGAAVGPDAAAAITDLARDALLDQVLLPYDRLIGQYKKPDDVRGLGARGRARFAQALEGVPGVDPASREAALGVFDRIVEMVEEGRRRACRHVKGDERKVWLPLELALRSDQHDTQAKLDAVIERGLARPFARGNAIFPANSTRFLLELLRSIGQAEDYHVLWTHDFTGYFEGKPDPVGARVVVEGYLKALADRVRAYDRTGRLPVFMIFQTQFFYEANGDRLYLSLLEDPLGRELKLGPGFENIERQVRAAQDELRRAVSGSSRLQAMARERGERWLRRLVKVHVNVTYPADLSFRSSRILSIIPFTPDSVVFDHRKLFFYDVTEEDPGRGGAVFTGAGVGSTYASPTWEDRGLLVAGPALLGLKAAARQMLRSQGFGEDEIPGPLLPRPLAPDYDARVAALEADGRDARALVAMNEPGFAPKDATFAQSLLYTLAPADTILVVPDAIWTNPYWAGQLVGAALRGCHVYILAASTANSAAPSDLVMARTRELFIRLLLARKVLGDEIAAAGGHLRVGLYTRQAPSGDTLAKIREVAEGFRRFPFLAEEFPVPAGLEDFLDAEAAALEASGYKTVPLAEGREGLPRLHRKTQIFVTRRALRAVADDPQTLDSLRRLLGAVAEATGDPTSVLDEADPLGAPNDIREGLRTRAREAARDGVFYLTVGSKNQDSRSALLDGDVSCVVAGPAVLWSYADFMFLMAATTWLEDPATLDKLIPLTNEKHRWFHRKTRRMV